MQYPKYKIDIFEDSEIFEFTSIGFKGKIDKVIEFQATENSLLYNLAFGDKIRIYKGAEGKPIVEMDDNTKSENGDRDKVLATVASAVKSLPPFIQKDR